jgi:hypothetical protein
MARILDEKEIEELGKRVHTSEDFHNLYATVNAMLREVPMDWQCVLSFMEERSMTLMFRPDRTIAVTDGKGHMALGHSVIQAVLKFQKEFPDA